LKITGLTIHDIRLLMQKGIKMSNAY